MKKLILAAIVSALPASAIAHDIWIKSDLHEINSEEQQTFALDVSRSADVYIAEANHKVNNLVVTSPNGVKSNLQAAFSGKVKEVFEVEYNEAGTYHFESPMTQVYLSFYFDEEGKKHKVRMPKTQYSKLPKGARPEKTVEKQIMTETYVSYNGFTDVQNVRANGIQIVPLQHPNKLRSGQPFSFKITYNGKPVTGAEVALKSLNQFYYQDSDKVEVVLKDKDNGQISFTPQTPGKYLLGVELEIELANDKYADFRSIERFLTFEITE